MTKVCFFNHFNHGDLFHSKPFIRDVIKVIGKENVILAHCRNDYFLRDLDVQNIPVGPVSHMVKFGYSPEHDMAFINTWVGAYFDIFYPETSLNFNMKMWWIIFDHLNENMGTNLKLGSMEEYLPYIDYSYYDLKTVNEFVKQNHNKKVLFVNGPGASSQCVYNEDMADIILANATEYPNTTFITTSSIKHDRSNIVYTGEIIKSQNCDLNEIGYLSEFCDFIIGRYSGPFCFAANRDNVNDPMKTFYVFGDNERYDFMYRIPLKSDYTFRKFTSKTEVEQDISHRMEKIHSA